MGTSLAPLVADLFLIDKERQLFQSHTVHPTFFVRYLDDGLMIWPHSLAQLDAFVHKYNKLSPRIHIKVITHQYHIDFLDVEIHKDLSNSLPCVRLFVRTHQKSMNSYTYIPWTSMHPAACMRGWVVAELRRYVLTCTHQEDYMVMRDRFFQRLTARGYPLQFLHEMDSRVHHSHRDSYIHGPSNRSRDEPTTRVVHLVLPHTREFAGSRLASQLHAVNAQHEAPGCPLRVMIAWKRAPNIQSLCVRAREREPLVWPPLPGP